MSEAALACEELIKCCLSGKLVVAVHEQDYYVRTNAIDCAKNNTMSLEWKSVYNFHSQHSYLLIKLWICCLFKVNLGDLIFYIVQFAYFLFGVCFSILIHRVILIALRYILSNANGLMFILH